MTLLSTRHLSRHFGGLKAVEDVDFELPAGQVRALIGPNGAGKTTFVGMLSGRIPASRGQVFFDGRDVTAEPAHRRIRAGMAYTFQITSVYGRLPVTENVALALRWRGRQRCAGASNGGAVAWRRQRCVTRGRGIATIPMAVPFSVPTSSTTKVQNPEAECQRQRKL